MNEIHGLQDSIKHIFNIEQYNLIQDDDYYYLFRALNNGDHHDMESGITQGEDGNLTHVRADRARFVENNSDKRPLYDEDEDISLIQVIDHIKKGHRIDTNCISLSSNANVSVMYGHGNYHDEYVLIRVPKDKVGEKVYNASEYMLLEMEKRIQDAIVDVDDSEIAELMKKIDSAENIEELMGLVSDSYKVPQADEEIATYSGPAGEAKRKTPIRRRFSNNPILDDDQNLLKNKIVAKLTILEERNYIAPIVSNNMLDSTAIRTLGMAISSSEILHYGDIRAVDENNEKQLYTIPKELMHCLGILQQVSEKRPDLADKVHKMENTIIKDAMNGLEVAIPISYEDDESYERVSIKQAYEFYGGKLQYEDANETLAKVYYLSNSVLRARQYSTLINELMENDEINSDVIDAISDFCLDVDIQLMDRKGESEYKISESVSIPLMKYEEGLVQEIQHRQTSDLEEISLNRDKSKQVLENLSRLKEEPVIPIDEYYARAIFSLYNWEKEHIRFSKAHKEKFIKKLKERKISVIYENLKDSGIDESKLPGIIMNLFISDREDTNKILDALEQGNISAEIISMLNNTDSEYNKSIDVEKIEDFLDFYKVEGTDFDLRDYQKSAVNNAEKIFKNHKFASVILPTGAGKTFVAIAELLNQTAKNVNGKILYLAPSDEILDQVKKYAEIYVHGEKLDKSRDQIFKEIFPNVELATYQSLLTKSDDELKSMQYDFIILDELHRTGAEKWGEKINILLKAQEESTRVLGITATPQRDVDNRNMADEIAKLLGFSNEEIKYGRHIAKNMNLVDAIRLGIVTAPKIVECDYLLKDDERWNSLLDTIKSMEDGPEKEEYERRYEKLKSRVETAKGIPELFRDNIVKKDGRYIFYMPVGANDYIEDEEGNIIGTKSASEKIKQAEEQLKEWLKYVDSEPEFYSMLGAYGQAKNTQQLNAFEDSNSNHIKVMIVMNKLNEGVHVRGINGIFWQRALDEDSSILLMQQLGRAISSRKKGSIVSNEDRPVVIDIPNNLSRVNLNRIINTYTEAEDLIILQNILDWIHENDEILPDINSQFIEEARLARELKRIQTKYIKYTRDEEFSKLDKDVAEDVSLILNIGSEIELWDITLPDKEITEQEMRKKADNTSLEEFLIEGVEKELQDLLNETKQIKPIMEWIRENERIPGRSAERKEYDRWRKSKEKELIDDYYEGKKLEEFTEEEQAIINELIQFGYKKVQPIMEWIRENGRIPNYKQESKEYNRWGSSKEKELIDDYYEGKKLEEFTEEEQAIINELIQFGYKKVQPIMVWIRENGKIPKDGTERNEYDRWGSSKEKKLIDSYYEGKKLEEFTEEEQAIINELIQFGYKKVQPIMEWIRENDRIPKDGRERNEYIRWRKSKEKELIDDYYEGKKLEEFTEEEQAIINELIQFGYKRKEKVQPIMEWIRENGKIPQKGPKKNEYQRWWESKEKNLIDSYYEGKKLEEFTEEEQAIINELIQFGYKRKEKVQPIMEWIRENERIPGRSAEKKEYQRWWESKEKKLIDSYYEGKKLEEFTEEEQAIINELIQFGYKYRKRGKSLNPEDIAQATYDALAPACDEAENLINGLIKEQKEQNNPEVNVNKN